MQSSQTLSLPTPAYVTLRSARNRAEESTPPEIRTVRTIAIEPRIAGVAHPRGAGSVQGESTLPVSMLKCIWPIITALTPGTVFKRADALERLAAIAFARARSPGRVIASTVSPMIATNSVTAGPHAAILPPARMLPGRTSVRVSGQRGTAQERRRSDIR